MTRTPTFNFGDCYTSQLILHSLLLITPLPFALKIYGVKDKGKNIRVNPIPTETKEKAIEKQRCLLKKSRGFWEMERGGVNWFIRLICSPFPTLASF